MPSLFSKKKSELKITAAKKSSKDNKKSDVKKKSEKISQTTATPKRNKQQKNDIAQLLFCALRTVFRKAIEAVSGPSRVAIQSFLRGVFSPLTENNTDYVSVDNFRRAVDLRLPFSARQILHTPLGQLLPSAKGFVVPGADSISMLTELLVVFGGKKIKGGSVDCNRFILGVVCQDTAVVDAVISLRKAVQSQIQRHTVARRKTSASPETSNVLKRSGYARKFDKVAYEQILDSRASAESVQVSDEETKLFLKTSKLISEFGSQSKRKQLRAAISVFVAQENNMEKEQLKWITEQNALRPDPAVTKKKKKKTLKKPSGIQEHMLASGLHEFTSISDFVHTVRCLVNDLLRPHPRVTKLPSTHPTLPIPSVFRQGWLTDLKLSNCVSNERELSLRGYHRVPVNIHHRHSLHVLDEHHRGGRSVMSTYLWYRRMGDSVSTDDEGSSRPGDGFVVLDVVAGPQPRRVSFGAYEQVCGIKFVSRRNRRETTILNSSVVSMNFKRGISSHGLEPVAEKSSAQEVAKDMAYVAAEVQLWMLRVPLDAVNGASFTPPSVLSDIALSLPPLLLPPLFCRTGLSNINKESLLGDSRSGDTVEVDALCEHASSFYSVQRQFSKSTILVPGLGRLPPAHSLSSDRHPDRERARGKSLPGPGAMRLDTEMLFRCGSSLARRKLRMGPRHIEEFSPSWLTVCMHRHCPPSILLLLQELQTVMREFVSAKGKKKSKGKSSSHRVPAFLQTKFFDDDDERGVREGKRSRGHDSSTDLNSLLQPENYHVLLDHFFASEKSSKDASARDLNSKSISPEKFATHVVKMFHAMRKSSETLFKLSSQEAVLLAKQIVKIETQKNPKKKDPAAIENKMWCQVALWLVPSAEEAKNITKQDIWTFFETFLPAAPECTKLVPVQPVPIPPPVGTEDKARNVLAACLQESLRLKKRIAYAVDPDGRGVRVSFKALQKALGIICKKEKTKKDVHGKGVSVRRFKKIVQTSLKGKPEDDEVMLALAHLVSGDSVNASLQRYVIDGRAFTEFALTNLYDTERATTTAITIGNTTIEIKVPRNMKPGDFLKVQIPGFSSKFKATIPKFAKPGDLISIALPRNDPGSTDEHNESEEDLYMSRGKSRRKKKKPIRRSHTMGLMETEELLDESRDHTESARHSSTEDSDEESSSSDSNPSLEAQRSGEKSKPSGSRDTRAPYQVLRVTISPADYTAQSSGFFKNTHLEFISSGGSVRSDCVCRSESLVDTSALPRWSDIEVPLKELCGEEFRKSFRIALCVQPSRFSALDSTVHETHLAVGSATVSKFLAIAGMHDKTLELRLARLDSSRVKKMPRGWHPKLYVHSAIIAQGTAKHGVSVSEALEHSLPHESTHQIRLKDLQSSPSDDFPDSRARRNRDRHHSDTHGRNHSSNKFDHAHRQYYSYDSITDTLPDSVNGTLKVLVVSATGLRPTDGSGSDKRKNKKIRREDSRRRSGHRNRINPFVRLALMPPQALVSQSKDDLQRAKSQTTWCSEVLRDAGSDPCFAAALPPDAREHSFSPLLFGRQERVAEWPHLRVQVCHSGSYGQDETPLAHGMINLREIIQSAKEISQNDTKGAEGTQEKNENTPVDVLILSLRCRHLESLSSRSSRPSFFFEISRPLHEELDDSKSSDRARRDHRDGSDSERSHRKKSHYDRKHDRRKDDRYGHSSRGHRHQHSGAMHTARTCWLRVFKSSLQDRHLEWDGLQIPIRALTGQVPRKLVMKQKLRFCFWDSSYAGRDAAEPRCNLLARCVVSIGSLIKAGRNRASIRLPDSPAMQLKLGYEDSNQVRLIVDEARITERVVQLPSESIHLSLGLGLEKPSESHSKSHKRKKRRDTEDSSDSDETATAESTDRDSYESSDSDGLKHHRRHHHHHVHNDFPPEIVIECEWTSDFAVAVQNSFAKALALSVQLKGLTDLPKRLGQSRSLCWVKLVRHTSQTSKSTSADKGAAPVESSLDLGDLMNLDENDRMKDKLESAKVRVNPHAVILWRGPGSAGKSPRQVRKSANETKEAEDCLRVVVRPEEANAIMATAATEALGQKAHKDHDDQGFRVEAQVWTSITRDDKAIDALVGWTNLPLQDMIADLHKSLKPSSSTDVSASNRPELDLDDLFSDDKGKDEASDEAKKNIRQPLTDRSGKASRGVLLASLTLSDKPHDISTKTSDDNAGEDRTEAEKLVREAIEKAPSTPRKFQLQQLGSRIQPEYDLRKQLVAADADKRGVVDTVEFVMAMDAGGVSLQTDELAALMRRLCEEEEIKEFKSGKRKTVMLDYDMFCSAALSPKDAEGADAGESPADAALAKCRSRARDQPQAMVDCKRLLGKLDQSTDSTLSRGQFKRVLRMSFGSGVLSDSEMEAIAATAADEDGDRVKYKRFIELVETEPTSKKSPEKEKPKSKSVKAISRLREWMMQPSGGRGGGLMSKKVIKQLRAFENDGDAGPVVSRSSLRRVFTRLKSPIESHEWKDLFQLLERSYNRAGDNIADEHGEILYKDFVSFCLRSDGGADYGDDGSHGDGDRRGNKATKVRSLREFLHRSVYRHSNDGRRRLRRLLEAQDESGTGLLTVEAFEDVLDATIREPSVTPEHLRLLGSLFGTDDDMVEYDRFMHFATFAATDVKDLSGALGTFSRRTLKEAFERFDIKYTGRVAATQFKAAVKKILKLPLVKYQIHALAEYFKAKDRKSRRGESLVDYAAFINELFPSSSGRETRRSSPKRQRPKLKIDTSGSRSPNVSPITSPIATNNRTNTTLGLSVTPVRGTGTASAFDSLELTSSLHHGLRLKTGVRWTCPVCAFVQYQRANNAGCEMCNAPNPDPVFAESGDDTPPKPTVIWVCPDCAYENPVGAKQCQVCKHEFPQSPEKQTAPSSESRADAVNSLVLSSAVVLSSSDDEPPRKDDSRQHVSSSRHPRSTSRSEGDSDEDPSGSGSKNEQDSEDLYIPTQKSKKKQKQHSRRRKSKSNRTHPPYYPSTHDNASYGPPHQPVPHPHYLQPQPMSSAPHHAMFANTRSYGGYGAMRPANPRMNSMHSQAQQHYQQPPFYPDMSMMSGGAHANLWQTQTQNNKTLEAKTAWAEENKKLRQTRRTRHKSKSSLRHSSARHTAPLSSRRGDRNKLLTSGSTIGGGTGMLVLGSTLQKSQARNTKKT